MYGTLLSRAFILYVHACQNIASVVEARTSSFGYPDQALLLFILPHSGGAVLAARDECAVKRVQIQVRD
jgi:hypothetical protein